MASSSSSDPALVVSSAIGASSMLFSSGKCPPAVGLEHSCELPFGFVWTPLAAAAEQHNTNHCRPTEDPADEMASKQIPNNNNNALAELGPHPLQEYHHQQPIDIVGATPPPILCVTCLAYMNVYCRIVEKQQVQVEESSSPSRTQRFWICPFCRGENVVGPHETKATSAWMEQQVLVSPTYTFRQPLYSGAHNHYNSSQPAAAVDDLTIVVVIDTNLPSTEAHSIGRVLQSVLLNNNQTNHHQTNIHLGLILFGKNVSIYQLGAVASGIMASCDTVRSHHEAFVWEQQDRWYLSGDVTSGIQALLNCLAAQFGVDSNEDNNHNNSNMPTSSAPETSPVLPQSRLELLRERKEARLRAKAQQQQQQETFHGNTTTAPPPPQSRLPHSPWTTARARATAQQPCHRCTGEAVQCALDLAAASAGSTDRKNSRTARILLFTNGCPNRGDASVVVASTAANGEDVDETSDFVPAARTTSVTIDSTKLARASEYLSLVATAAAEGGIGIDVFCTGSSELGWPVYQSLVEPSGGYVLMHDTFVRSESLRGNLTWIVQHTHLSLAQLCAIEQPNNEKKGTNSEDEENFNPVGAAATVATGSPPNSEGAWVEGCTVDIRLSRFVRYDDGLINSGWLRLVEHLYSAY